METQLVITETTVTIDGTPCTDISYVDGVLTFKCSNKTYTCVLNNNTLSVSTSDSSFDYTSSAK